MTSFALHNMFFKQMELPANRIKTVMIHALIWLLYFIYESSILLIIDSIKLNYWESGLNFTLYACIFYLNSLVLLPYFIERKRYVLLVIATILLLALVTASRYGLYLYIIPEVEGQILRPFTNHKLFLAQTVWRGGYFIILSFGYFFVLHAIRNERSRRILEEIKRKRERKLRKVQKRLLLAQIAYFKSQINPHFLYNSLNFLYSQVYAYSESAARSVLLLSDIMRYNLKDDVTDKAMLESEVQHLRNYIEMNQLRFNHNLQIDFEVSGALQYRMIAPMVLITLVENCFKHGELLDPAHPLTLRIDVQGDKLLFYSRNKKRGGPKEQSTGIGLNNIRKRLDLHCPNRYTLNIEDAPTYYTCTLTLEL